MSSEGNHRGLDGFLAGIEIPEMACHRVGCSAEEKSIIIMGTMWNFYEHRGGIPFKLQFTIEIRNFLKSANVFLFEMGGATLQTQARGM